MKLTVQQQAYIMLTAALEKLHDEHFPNCNGINDVLDGCDADDEVTIVGDRADAVLDRVYASINKE